MSPSSLGIIQVCSQTHREFWPLYTQRFTFSLSTEENKHMYRKAFPNQTRNNACGCLIIGFSAHKYSVNIADV
jgi:hypothetical protein